MVASSASIAAAMFCGVTTSHGAIPRFTPSAHLPSTRIDLARRLRAPARRAASAAEDAGGVDSSPNSTLTGGACADESAGNPANNTAGSRAAMAIRTR